MKGRGETKLGEKREGRGRGQLLMLEVRHTIQAVHGI